MSIVYFVLLTLFLDDSRVATIWSFLSFPRYLALKSTATLVRSSNVLKLMISKLSHPCHLKKTVKLIIFAKIWGALRAFGPYIKNLKCVRGYTASKSLFLLYYCFWWVFSLISGRISGKAHKRSYCSNPIDRTRKFEGVKVWI